MTKKKSDTVKKQPGDIPEYRVGSLMELTTQCKLDYNKTVTNLFVIVEINLLDENKRLNNYPIKFFCLTDSNWTNFTEFNDGLWTNKNYKPKIVSY